MAWWGKLVGGALGFMLGGPMGAILGASFGHSFDSSDRQREPRIGYAPGDQERTQTAFFTATFSVMGHIAKADGHVSQHEISMAKQLMDHMQLNEEQRKLAISLFDQGKQPDFPLKDVVDQFRSECHRRTTLIQMFVEIQVQAALSDGEINPAENQVLRNVASWLGFAPDDLSKLIEMLRGAQESHSRSHKPRLEDAYRTLGVSADTSMAEIRKAYRRLISQHHPDKLVSKGLPEEMIKLANERTGEIRSAWELIEESRARA